MTDDTSPRINTFIICIYIVYISFIPPQVDLNRRFAQFELNSDEDDEVDNKYYADGRREAFAATVHNPDIRLFGAGTPLIITDLEDCADSIENLSIITACHSSSGSEDERQSVIRGDDSCHAYVSGTAVNHTQPSTNSMSQPIPARCEQNKEGYEQKGAHQKTHPSQNIVRLPKTCSIAIYVVTD